MIIKKRTIEQCKECGHRHVTEGEAYGCDTCKTPINFGQPEREYLVATVFSQHSETRDIHACSWKCMLEALRKEPCDHFISMPYLTYDSAQPGMRAQDFFAALLPQNGST